MNLVVAPFRKVYSHDKTFAVILASREHLHRHWTASQPKARVQHDSESPLYMLHTIAACQKPSNRRAVVL